MEFLAPGASKNSLETILEQLPEPSYIFTETANISPNLVNARILVTASPECAPHQLCINDPETVTGRYICLPPWPLPHLAVAARLLVKHLDIDEVISRFHAFGRSPRNLFGVPEKTEWKLLMSEAAASISRGTVRDILVESFDQYLKVKQRIRGVTALVRTQVN